MNRYAFNKWWIPHCKRAGIDKDGSFWPLAAAAFYAGAKSNRLKHFVATCKSSDKSRRAR